MFSAPVAGSCSIQCACGTGGGLVHPRHRAFPLHRVEVDRVEPHQLLAHERQAGEAGAEFEHVLRRLAPVRPDQGPDLVGTTDRRRSVVEARCRSGPGVARLDGHHTQRVHHVEEPPVEMVDGAHPVHQRIPARLRSKLHVDDIALRRRDDDALHPALCPGEVAQVRAHHLASAPRAPSERLKVRVLETLVRSSRRHLAARAPAAFQSSHRSPASRCRTGPSRHGSASRRHRAPGRHRRSAGRRGSGTRLGGPAPRAGRRADTKMLP